MKRQRLGVFKFSSCDGCQLSILNLEEEILTFIGFFEVGYFREATDKPLRGHFDVSLVEGSITTERQKDDVIDIRERSRYLISIGACATSGGIQALRNWASLPAYKKYVYPSPDIVEALSTSTPVADHVYVDYELWGCPIDTRALSEVMMSFLIGKKPRIPTYSLCMECKLKGVPCLLVAQGEPCLGPVTKAGCGVLCPSLRRPCYGCFGPKDGANIESLMKIFRERGISHRECMSLLDKMNTYAYRRARIEQDH